MLSAFAPAPAFALEVRVCGETLRPAVLNDERGMQSALLQAFAVANDGAEPLDLASIRFDLLAAGRVIDSRTWAGAEIDRGFRQAPMVEALARVLPAQFCNGGLLGDGTLAKGATLAPGEVVVFLHEHFAWQGERDALEISETTGNAPDVRAAARKLDIGSAAGTTPVLFPVEGTSYVAVAASLHTPHRWVATEEFAYDIVVLEGGKTHRGTGALLEDYGAFGRPVRAVAAGAVVVASDAMPDNVAMLKRADESDETYLARLRVAQGSLLVRGMAAIAGNHVIIDHGNGEFSVYAHLKHGSVAVRVGDQVAAGELLGAIGSSGNSTEPHLHFQSCDQSDLDRCRSVPVSFRDIRLPLELAPRAVQSGDIVETLK